MTADAAPAGDAPFLRLPDPGALFEGRARRLRTLAADHSASEWLLLLARIADGQAAAVRAVAPPPVRAAGEGPPLARERVPRDGAWIRMLRHVNDAARAGEAPAAARAALSGLSDASPEALESLARGVLGVAPPAASTAAAPFVAAALQAWFTALAAQVDPAAVAPCARTTCPVCGTPPTASLVAREERRRFLACALCAAEWSYPRIHCAGCGGNERVSYLHLEGEAGVQAEACGSCRAYLKLFDLEKRPGADPLADDAATLPLDLLMAEEGYQPAGANPFLWVAAEAPPAPRG